MILSKINNLKIKSSFSKAALRYDIFASLQKEIAEELIDKLIAPCPLPIAPIRILDIGCGTGFLTHGMAKAFRKANIFGCDIAHGMIDVTRGKGQTRGKRIYLLTADGGVLPYKGKAFDMAASNLAYQWIYDIKTAFSEAHRVLRQGGIFMFSTLGTETLKELRYCYTEASAKFSKNGLPPFMGFSEKQAIKSALESAGFKNISIEITKLMKVYPDMWALLKAMKSIGAGNPFKDGDKSLGRGSLLKKMAEEYKQKFGVWGSEFAVNLPHPTSRIPHPNHIYATYEGMFVHAEK